MSVRVWGPDWVPLRSFLSFLPVAAFCLAWNFSTRPSWSTKRISPVKKGWHFAQMSTVMASLVEPEIKEAPQEQVMVIWLYFGWMFAFMGGILSQIDTMCILSSMNILEINGTNLADISNLQGNLYAFSGNKSGIIWDIKSQLSYVLSHSSQMEQLLTQLGWVENAVIKAARINTRDKRISWALQNISDPQMGDKVTFNEKRPFLTLTFPILQNILNARIYF